MLRVIKKHRLNKVKDATVNREVNSLSKMLSLAKQNGFIDTNPCSGVKKLKVENFKIRFLTKDEETKLFEAIGDHWLRPIVIIVLQTGMRKTEILELKWDCVDFNKKYINVLKTKNGKARQIPMSSKLVKTLKDLPRINEYVFVNNIKTH